MNRNDEIIEYFIRVDSRAENKAVQEWLSEALGVEFPYSEVGSHLGATALFWTSNYHGGMGAIDEPLTLSYIGLEDVDVYLARCPALRKEVKVNLVLEQDNGKLRVDPSSVIVKFHGPGSEQAEQKAPKVNIIKKADIPAGEYSLEDLYAIIAQLEGK